MSVPTSESAIPPTVLTKAPLMLLRAVVGDLRDQADAAHAARLSGQPRGPVSGLKPLDRELGGAFEPGLHIVHGNAGAGKTAFALQVASSCAFPALFVSCEMSPVEILRRHTARVTETFLNRLRSGEMDGLAVEKLALKAVTSTPLLALMDATRDAAPLQHLFDCAQIVRGEHAQLLVVVDSLHSWAQSLSAGLPEYESLNAGLSDLSHLARKLECPVLIVSERNRDSMKSGGINAGAGTRRIEYGAETVIDLDREAAAQETGAGETPVTLKLGKNRHGPADKKIPLFFHGALQRFRAVERPHEAKS